MEFGLTVDPKVKEIDSRLVKEAKLITNHAFPPFLSIQYPGQVNNLDKAIQRLGYKQHIDNCWTRNTDLYLTDQHRPNPKSRIFLSFRPNDVSSHPIVSDDLSFSDELSTPKTLYLIGKRFRKWSKSKDKYLYKTQYQFIGYSPFTFEFDNLADFQLLPIDGNQQNLNEKLGLKQNLQRNQDYFTKPLSDKSYLWAIPTEFSRFSKPDYKYTFTPDYQEKKLQRQRAYEEEFKRQGLDPATGKKIKEANPVQSEVIKRKPTLAGDKRKRATDSTSSASIINKEPKTDENSITSQISGVSRGRKSRIKGRVYHLSTGVRFEELELPSQDEIDQHISRAQINNECYKLINKLFTERPIWLFSGIESRLFKFKYDVIKYTIPLVAYHIDNGPWQKAWVRYNYNPYLGINCNEAKRYQVVDFRYSPDMTRDEQIRLNIWDVPSVNDLKAKLRTELKKVDQDLTKVNDLQSIKEIIPKNSYPKIHQLIRSMESFYTYVEGTISPKKQIYYQIVDIHLPLAQKECAREIIHIRKKLPPDASSGWFYDLDLQTAGKGAGVGIITKIRRQTKQSLDKSIKIKLKAK